MQKKQTVSLENPASADNATLHFLELRGSEIHEMFLTLQGIKPKATGIAMSKKHITAFTISMVETALRWNNNKIEADKLGKITDMERSLSRFSITLLLELRKP